MNESLSSTVFDVDPIHYKDHKIFTPWAVALISIGVALISILIIVYVIIRCLVARQRRDNVQDDWAALSDLNNIRYEFRSIDSLQTYLSQQTIFCEMRTSILILVVMIIVNTYTNANVFWHFNQEDAYPHRYIRGVAALEVTLSLVMIIMPFILYQLKYYDQSINVMIIAAPSISALIYFALFDVLFVNQIKSKVNRALESKKLYYSNHYVVYITWYVVGIFILWVKANQMSYIYDISISSRAWYDFIAVFGIARQFASLYSMGDEKNCWGFVFSTLHPRKKKEKEDNDPGWDRKFDVDNVVCREMIVRFGVLRGYCWLCYTFSNLEEVKKLYLEYNGEEDQLSHADHRALISSNITEDDSELI